MQHIVPAAKRVFESRILRDSSALMVSNVASTGMGLATSVVLARRLGAGNYGLIILAITIVSTIVNFLDIRTSEGLIKFMGSALARGDQREAITFFYVGLSADFALMLVTMAVVTFGTPLAADAYKKGEVLRQLATVFILTVPFTTLQNSFGAVLTVFKKFRLQAVVSFLSSLTLLVALVVLSERGVAATMWGYVIAAGVTFGLWVGLGGTLLLRNFDSLRGKDYRGAWRQFLPFAFHTSLTASIKAIFSNMDILLLGVFRPPSEVGFYKIARSAVGLLALPVAPVRAVIYPALTEAWSLDNKQRVKDLVKAFIVYSTALSIVGALGLFVVAGWLVRVLYGLDFAPTVMIIYVVSVGSIFGSSFLWARPTALAAGRPEMLTYVSLLTIVLQTALAIPLIWAYGAVGAGVAFTLAMAISSLLNTRFILMALALWIPRYET